MGLRVLALVSSVMLPVTPFLMPQELSLPPWAMAHRVIGEGLRVEMSMCVLVLDGRACETAPAHVYANV